MNDKLSRRRFLAATGSSAGFIGLSGCLSDTDIDFAAEYGDYNHYGNGSKPIGGYWIAGFFVPTDSLTVGFGYQVIIEDATGSDVYYAEDIKMHDERINPSQDNDVRYSTEVGFRAADMKLWVFSIYKKRISTDESDSIKNWKATFDNSNKRLIPFLKENIGRENTDQGSLYTVSVPNAENEDNEWWVNQEIQQLILADQNSTLQPR